jgi:nicotinic acid phosphoribosyltransferase
MTKQQGTLIIILLMLIVGYGSMQVGRQAAANYWAQRCYDARVNASVAHSFVSQRDAAERAQAEACKGINQ